MRREERRGEEEKREREEEEGSAVRVNTRKTKNCEFFVLRRLTCTLEVILPNKKNTPSHTTTTHQTMLNVDIFYCMMFLIDFVVDLYSNENGCPPVLPVSLI